MTGVEQNGRLPKTQPRLEDDDVAARGADSGGPRFKGGCGCAMRYAYPPETVRWPHETCGEAGVYCDSECHGHGHVELPSGGVVCLIEYEPVEPCGPLCTEVKSDG